VTNLKTGSTRTASVACGTTNGTSNGIFVVGNGPALTIASATSLATVSAIMYSSALLAPTQLLAWASDPWSFWYPPTQQQVLFSSLSPATAPIPASNPTLMSQCWM